MGMFLCRMVNCAKYISYIPFNKLRLQEGFSCSRNSDFYRLLLFYIVYRSISLRLEISDGGRGVHRLQDGDHDAPGEDHGHHAVHEQDAPAPHSLRVSLSVP